MSNSDMNPEHLEHAKKECEELLDTRLIKPSDPQWAFEALFVHK